MYIFFVALVLVFYKQQKQNETKIHIYIKKYLYSNCFIYYLSNTYKLIILVNESNR